MDKLLSFSTSASKPTITHKHNQIKIMLQTCLNFNIIFFFLKLKNKVCLNFEPSNLNRTINTDASTACDPNPFDYEDIFSIEQH